MDKIPITNFEPIPNQPKPPSLKQVKYEKYIDSFLTKEWLHSYFNKNKN